MSLHNGFRLLGAVAISLLSLQHAAQAYWPQTCDPDTYALGKADIAPDALFKAIARHDLAAVRLQLKAGADPNEKNRDGQTALQVAAQESSRDCPSPGIVQALIAAHADVNAYDTPDLSDENDEGDRRGKTALWYTDDPVSFHALIAAGADVNSRSLGDGTTILYETAAMDNDVVRTKMLLAAGADPNERNNDKAGSVADLTPLMSMDESDLSTTGRAAMVRALLAAGADPNARDQNNETPLMLMMTSVHGPDAVDIINQLVAAGADVNARSKFGYTVLDILDQLEEGPTAVRSEVSDGVRAALIKAGARRGGQ